MRKGVLTLVAVLALASCESPWTVLLGEEMQAVPETYETWFGQVARCLGMPERATRERFELIRWFTAADIYNATEDQHAWGLWEEPHTITLLDGHELQAWVVKHEMIHDLLGRGGHPEPWFDTCV